jgi:hypothetical protein
MVRRWGDLQACVRAWAHRTCRRCRGCSRSSIADGCDSHTGHGGHGVTSGPERSLARIARLHSWIGVQEGPMESARTTVRRPGSLRGAATVMVGNSRRLGHLGSITGLRSSLGPGPPLDPCRRRWQLVTQGARVGLAPQRSRTEPVLFALGCPFIPRWQSHRPPSTTDDLVDDPAHGSPMDATTVGTVGSVLGLTSIRWGSVRSGTSSSASASMAWRS